jgi:hypothetical protein
MLASPLERKLPAAAPADLPELDDEDELAPARGLALGLLMGVLSLAALSALLWWAFA